MKCKRVDNPNFKKRLTKIQKKDRPFYERIERKIGSILENPQLSKPSKREYKNLNHVDLGSEVLFFHSKVCEVTFHLIISHDTAFRK